MVSGGGDASSSGGSVAYSIGQIDYSNVSSANHNYNEGVQQPYEFYVTTNGIEELDLGISIFPNPSNGEITIALNQDNLNPDIELFDASGKLIFSRTLTQSESKIQLSSYASGIYALRITANAKSQTYKIVKN